MNFLAFRDRLSPFKVFSTRDIEKEFPGFDSRRLVEWQQKGYLRKIRNRWYRFLDEEMDEPFLFLIANKIYSPSYVSFESALSWHNLIPEGVFSFTSATTLKTSTFSTPDGRFFYRHIQPRLFFGYQLHPLDSHVFQVAEPEKALLDFLYFRTGKLTRQDLSGFRLNLDVACSALKRERIKDLLQGFQSPVMEERVQVLFDYLYA